MSRRYAADTIVTVERTQAEISTLLARHGATARAIGADDATDRASVMFSLGGRQVRVQVLVGGGSTGQEPRGWWHWTAHERQTWVTTSRAKRQRSTWRGILLLLRAKLEAIEGGYSSVEHEFLADVLLPGGRSVGELVSPMVETAYMTGVPPRLLPQAS